MKITQRQLRRIIREEIQRLSEVEAPGPSNRENISDSVAHVLWEKGKLSGRELVAAVQGDYDWAGATPSNEEIFSALDELLEEGEVIFNVEEDEWSLNDRGNYYDYMAGFKS